MSADAENHNHQKHDDPIHRMFQQRKIDDFHLRTRTLLINPRSGPEHRETDGYHKHNGNPVGGVPAKNDSG